MIVARELKQQGKTIEGGVGILQQYSVFVLFLMQDVLEELLGDQGQLQVALVARVVIQDIENYIIRIEVLALAFGVKG